MTVPNAAVVKMRTLQQKLDSVWRLRYIVFGLALLVVVVLGISVAGLTVTMTKRELVMPPPLTCTDINACTPLLNASALVCPSGPIQDPVCFPPLDCIETTACLNNGNLTLHSLFVTNLTVVNTTHVAVAYQPVFEVADLIVNGSMTCAAGALISDVCLPQWIATINGITPSLRDFTISAGTNIVITQLANGIMINATTTSGGGGGGGGTVTSVTLALPLSVFAVSGPVTTSGTLTGTFVVQAAKTFFRGPASGPPAIPTFDVITPADMTCSSKFNQTCVDISGISCVSPVASACLPARIASVNGITPTVGLDFGVTAGTNIQIVPTVNGIVINTTNAMSLSMLSVSGATLLGTNTTCVAPLLPSCYDISNQACVRGALANNCLPPTAHFATLTVDNLSVVNGSFTLDYVNSSFFGGISVNGTLTCTGNGSISNGCLNLGGYTCPMGNPLADSCIPASLSFYDTSVTHTLTVNNVVCSGPALPTGCIPSLATSVLTSGILPIARGGTNSGTALNNNRIMVSLGGAIVEAAALTNGQILIGSTGVAPVAATITGTTNQVNVAVGAGTVTLSTPQNIHTAATPTFASETLTAVSNQLVLGATNTVTISSTAPSVSRVYTIPDAGAAANFVLDTGGALTITNAAVTSQVLTATGTGTASWQSPATSGTVTSVALALPVSVFSISGSPVTSVGTLTGSFQTQSANTLFAGPVSGSAAVPGFRAQVLADLPHLTNGQLYVGSTGASVVAATLAGTANQVSVANGAGTITLSTPQNIHTAATPTFASETLTAVTNQLVLGTTNTITISSTAPATSRVYTIPDAGAAANFVLDTGGSLTITNTASTGQVLTATGTNGASWQPPATSGTVTSVGLALPASLFSVSGSPVTISGTLTGSLISQSAKTFFRGPVGGGAAAAPTFGLITPDDLTCSSTFNTSCLPVRVATINSISPNGAFDFGITAGTNVLVTPTTNGIIVGTTSAMSLSMLTVSGATLLGTNTTCVTPLLASCYDISNQACPSGPLASNCIGDNLHIPTLTVDRLTVINGTFTSEYVNSSTFGAISVNGTLSCTGNGSISNGCLNLGGYTCPLGQPLADSCIPASLVFYDVSVTHALSINTLTCAGGAVPTGCIPTLDVSQTTTGIFPIARGGTNSGTALNNNRIIVSSGGALVESAALANGQLLVGSTGGAPVAALITGTSNQVNVAVGAGSITLSTPQNIATTSTPTFASETLTAVTNQLVLGTTNTVTISSTAPSVSRVYTIPDAGAAASFVLDTGGALTITNAASTNQVLTATGTGTASWQPPATSGTVTSVALALPVSVFSISGSPVTSTGTLTGSFATQAANTIFAGPTTGVNAVPTFRTQVLADLPQLTSGQLYIGSTGASVVAATISGTSNRVSVAVGAGTITLSAPQDIATASTPTFASETLTATTNQLTLGTTNTLTISSTAPSTSRVYTIPDAGANANFVLDTGGSLTVTNTATTGQVLTATGTNGATWQAPSADGFTSTATAAGTTTLTAASTQQQYFTGSTTQTVVLPDVTTLVNGARFKIVNVATGLVTVQSSAPTTIAILSVNGGWGTFTCINTAGGTGVASWSVEIGGAYPSGGTTVSVGSGNTVTGTSAVGVGRSVSSSGSGSVALGFASSATGTDSIAIGDGTHVFGPGGIGIGSQASTNSVANAIAMGTFANAGIGTDPIFIGNLAGASTASGASNIGIGTSVMSATTTFTGSISPTVSALGSGSGTTLTIASITFVTGQAISGTGIAAGTYIVTGGTGTTFTMSSSNTFASTTVTGAPTMTLTAAVTGALVVGMTISGTGVTGGTVVSSLTQGTVNVAGSTYTVGTSQTTASTTITGFSIAAQCTAVGYQALKTNLGSQNTAFGYQAGLAITTGSFNTVVGAASLTSLTTGTLNVAIGKTTATSITTGSFTVIIGANTQAAAAADGATCVGYGSSCGFPSAVGLGYSTQVGAQNGIGIGSAVATGSGTDPIFIGHSAGATTSTGASNIGIGTSVMSAKTTFTGSISPTVSALGSGSGTTLTIASITFVTGQAISGTGIAAGTYIVTGGTGTTFTMSSSNTFASTTVTGAPTMTLTAALTGALVVGMTISGTSVTGGTVVSSLTQGTVNVAGSTYTVSASQTTASTTITGFSVAAQSTAVGYQALKTAVGTQNTAFGYQAGTALTSGTNNVAVGNIAGNVLSTGSNNVMIGDNAQVSASVSNSNAIGRSTSVTASQASAIGAGGISNSVANTMVLGSNALEQMRLLDPATGGHTYRLVKSTQAGASPQTLTAAQMLGGYQEVTAAGAFTLNLDTGANLDANAQLAGNLYVGLSFRCIVVGSGASTVITLAGATGTTLKGVAAGAANAAIELLFYRTGAATWDCVAIHG